MNELYEAIENKIKESVSFLKSLGYELYAPVGDLYSKLQYQIWRILNFFKIKAIKQYNLKNAYFIFYILKSSVFL